MEGIHGVDVSWLHHSKKAGHNQKSASRPIPEPPVTPNHSSIQPSSVPKDQSNGLNGTATSSAAEGTSPTSHQYSHRPPIATRGSTETPASASPPNQKAGKESKLGAMGRRNSWMSSISSKFSSNSNSSATSSPTASTPPTKQAQSPHFEHPNPFGAAVAPGSKEAKKSDDTSNASPQASPKGHPSFLQSALRRLSSGGTATLGKASTTGGVCPRKVMNVDPYRERCDIPDLEQAKLRRVSFCVDVEIAPPAQYSEEEVEESPPPPPRRPSLTQLENQVDVKRKKDKKFKKGEGAALKSPQAVAEEKEVEGVNKASGEDLQSEKLAAAGSVEPAGKDSSRKKEKKKRSEAERKERKERRKNQALANGDAPRELKKESSSSDAAESANGASTPPKSQDRPTTDPLRIYRRCCQLRETPILKRITEQLASPSACPIATPGIISCLDLTGFWMQLPDIITLSDYLAVVPVKRLILENCGLGDEAVRVLLAGLLAAKTTEQAKHNKKLAKKTCEQIKKGKTEDLGVVEKVSLKNNPKIGRDGWRHICLFLYLSKSLKAIDLSRIALPQPIGESPDGPTATMDVSALLQKSIAERPAGSQLEELVMSECALTADTVGKIVDAVMQCGLTRLGLASNTVTVEGFEHILRFVRSGKCEGLDLGGNNMTEHLGTFVEALDERNPLYALSLADCNLETPQLDIILPALIRLPNFRFIDLSHNRNLFAARPSALDLLRKYLPRFPMIKRIHLLDVAMTPEHAIALAEVLPEIRTLAHLNILENHLLSPLASAKDEASQEEACALYASLMAAVRVSSTIICIDIDVPTADSSEVVKALAKQVVAYSLRNMEGLPITEANDSAKASMADPHGGEKHVTVPDVLLHLVGHVEGFPENHDNDEPAPDDDYIVGGTGVVKALGVCLNRMGDSRRASRDATPRDSGTVTPKHVLQGSEVNKGKAREMSKNLLGSARKIRLRLQPALVKEAREGDSMNYKRLQFLDSTLQRMIQRFEDEYPETRLQLPAPDIDISSPLSPQHVSLDSSSPAHYRSEAFGSSSGEPGDGTIHVPISRRGSDISLASRQAQEEGHMHRIGQRMRREILRPETEDHAHGTTGEEPEAEHLRVLRERLGEFGGEEIRQKLAELGPEGLFNSIGTTAEEIKTPGEQDPRLREGRLMELYNTGALSRGGNAVEGA